jgi:hypothetical protein
LNFPKNYTFKKAQYFILNKIKTKNPEETNETKTRPNFTKSDHTREKKSYARKAKVLTGPSPSARGGARVRRIGFLLLDLSR